MVRTVSGHDFGLLAEEVGFDGLSGEGCPFYMRRLYDLTQTAVDELYDRWMIRPLYGPMNGKPAVKRAMFTLEMARAAVLGAASERTYALTIHGSTTYILLSQDEEEEFLSGMTQTWVHSLGESPRTYGSFAARAQRVYRATLVRIK